MNQQLPLIKTKNGASLGFEETLWQAADKLRGSVDVSEYKYIVLGLIFLKYVSDTFEEKRKTLEERGLDVDNPSNYEGQNAFWVPVSARWPYLKKQKGDEKLGQLLDMAILEIAAHNPTFEGILSPVYSRPFLDKRRLGDLVHLIGTIRLGDEESRSLDVLGRVYEYFLGRFALAENKGGEYYTPSSVVQLLVQMVEPYSGKVYDPCCGSGGMFVQSTKFMEAHGVKREVSKIFGQELNPSTWRLCKMNLAIRGITADLGEKPADTFHDDQHPSLEADYILSNPPFNISDWGGQDLVGDERWQYGQPPNNNANLAWIQHIIKHLAPAGIAGFVLANGTLAATNISERNIRRALVEADLIDCIVALPSNLFYTTQISASLWFVTKDKQNPAFRNRRGETLFIHAEAFGHMTDRIHKELSEEDISFLADIYHKWRSKNSSYRDIPGLCKSASIQEIAEHKWALVPGRYVGFPAEKEDEWDVEKIRKELELVEERLQAANQVNTSISDTLKGLGNG